MKKVNKIVSIILIMLIIFSLGVIVYLRISNTKVFTLVSNSMEPSLKEGSLLFNQNKEFKDIEVGDIITYKLKNSDIYITHRVSEIDDINERILCKGDANDDVDNSFIDYEQYKGNLQFYLPFVGYIVIFMNGTFGRILGFILIVGLLLSVSYDLYRRQGNIKLKSKERIKTV